MAFQHNAWYVAALPQHIDRTLRRRVFLNEPVLLYRTEAGAVVAVQDRCPHRFAPLSRGTLFGDVVECKYHGLRYDRTGSCVLNPHDTVIRPNIRVRAYPVEERHGLVWLWPGDPALAHADDIPDLSHMVVPGVRTAHSYIMADYRYDILVDNLLDLSHADYLHVGSFAGGACGRSETRVQEQGDDVIVTFNQFDAPPPPFIPGLTGIVDQCFEIHWRPGQVITFEHSVVPAGGDLAAAGKLRFSHIVTPETEATTHYFMSITRDYALDDPEVDAQVSAGQVKVIQGEDSPMLGAVDLEMAGQDLFDMHPIILPTDTGALRVRRIMQRVIEAEAAQSSKRRTSMASA